MHTIKLNTLILLGLTTIYSCNNATKPNPSQIENQSVTDTSDLSKMIMLADTTFEGHQVSLWTPDSLTNKFESLYLKFEDGKGNPVSDLAVDYEITMDMGMMAHGGPYSPLVNKGKGIYQADVVFIMANMKDMGKGWLFKTLLIGKDKSDTLTFALPVQQTTIPRTIATGTTTDDRVFVSCLIPNEVESGKHNIEFALHKMDKETFTNLDGYTIAVEPFMPAMKHGSSENEDAESKGNGRYSGLVNFTMPGDWFIRVKLLKNGKTVSQDSLVYPIKIK
ncbi:FixH family protein [Sphingobacterium anhuiense]|uniref:FixH family protein n=1 Tax=Sphingobacterium anhuiense TaxID=493780 RepID=A0ABW5YVW0_9SPHI